jgi:hypothetical protein
VAEPNGLPRPDPQAQLPALVELTERLLRKHLRLTATAARESVVAYGAPGQVFPDSLFRTSPPASGLSRIVILWGETPHDPTVGAVDTARHLDPVALAYLMLAERRPDGVVLRGEPKLQIVVLDLGLDRNLRSSTYAYAKAVGTREDSWLRVFTIREIAEFGRCIMAPVVTLDESPRLETLRELLLAGLFGDQLDPGRSSGHHALANVLGPQLLLESMEEPARSGHRAALLQLCKVLGAIPAARSLPAPWLDAEVRRDVGGGSVVLVDDQAELGWASFLECAIGGKVRSISDPWILLDSIQAENVNGKPSVKFELPASVLVLDLRLFPESHQEERRRFYERAVELASILSRPASGSPDWPGFEAGDLARSKEWLESGARGKEPIETLSLIPRLVALAAPRLPIVLFSSTGQRGVEKLLRNYGNIITDFEKPRFWGVPIPLETTRARFRTAFGSAHRILRADRLRGALSNFRTPSCPDERTSGYVEIYLDESMPARASGRMLRKVGGLIAFYPSRDVADEFAADLMAHGILIGHTSDKPYGWRPDEENVVAKRPGLDEQRARLTTACAVADRHRTHLYAVSLGRPEPRTDAWSTGAIRPDHEHRELVSTLLELLLFSYGPWPDGLISHLPFLIHGATKLVVAGNEADAETVIEGANRYGMVLEFRSGEHEYCLYDQGSIESLRTLLTHEELCRCVGRLSRMDAPRSNGSQGQPNARPNWFIAIGKALEALSARGIAPLRRTRVKLCACSMSSDAIHPVLREVFVRRGCDWPSTCVEARCVMLKEFSAPLPPPPHLLPRQLHFLADWTVSLSFDTLPGQMRAGGFHDLLEPVLQRGVDAARFADAGMWARAVVGWPRTGLGDPTRSNTCARWLAPRISRAAKALSPRDLLEIASSLS